MSLGQVFAMFLLSIAMSPRLIMCIAMSPRLII